MPKNIGVIFGQESGIIRRFIHADDESTLGQHVGQGEALLVVPADEVKAADARDAPALDKALALVEKARGKPSYDSRAVLVDDTNKVVAVIHADPLLDSHPSLRLVAHATADMDWTFPSGTLTKDTVATPPIKEVVEADPIAGAQIGDV